MYRLSRPLYLASGSPRRRDLLTRFGIPYRLVAQHADESNGPFHAPAARVKALARLKAEDAARRTGRGVILAFDTLVFLNGCLLEKPKDAAEARRMLRALSNATHTVYTGMAALVRPEDRMLVRCETTRVTFRKLEEKEINNYIKSGEPFDKAGAYGIQGMGGAFIARINGCFFNVVGLPIRPLMDVLKPYFR
ncbi:MAG: Maf family protein [Fibrobacterota bacterium]